ncbi:hypothetical protein GGH13_002505 [Coemansia sp. S155-1]|nr:hypothetical protein GGH13_002505 [Coemansia sp. S155-1]
MKYWVHWLFVLATLTCALQLTFAGVEDVEDVEDGGVCEWDDDTDMVSILPFDDCSETFTLTDTLRNTLEVGKAVKETSLAQVSESSTWVTPALATAEDLSSTLNELSTLVPSFSVPVSTIFATPTLPEVSVQTVTVEKPPVTVFATLTSTLTLVTSDDLPSGMVRITDIDSLDTRVFTLSLDALAPLRMDPTSTPPPTAPKQ